ncbi:hypothetical protein ACFL5V_13545, partial [Fibrobacterota bacterium]
VISSHLVDILPARVPFMETWYFKFLFWTFGMALIIAAVKYFLTRRKKRKEGKQSEQVSFAEGVKELKSRLQSAGSKELLLNMETLCTRFLGHELKKSPEGKFESLLEEYLQTHPQHRDNWLKLRHDFELAKFGGGQKARHEILESYRTLKTCLHLKEENEHE